MLPTDEDRAPESPDLLDRNELRNYATFVRGSIRRRKWLVALVFSSILVLSVATVLALPKTYHVESKLLAQRSQVLAVRGDGPDAVAPTRGAVETVLRRDNLIALVETTDLVNHYRAHRAPAQRLLEGAAQLLFGEPSPEERKDAMVELLEKRLVVWTSDGTVSITIDWPDGPMACRLIDAAQQSFLETRYAQEITALSESITILEGHAESLTTDIDDAVAALVKLQGAKDAPRNEGAPAGAAPAPPGLRALSRRASEPSPELARRKSGIEAKQRVIDDLEGARRRRLSDLQAHLVELQATFTENHPTIIDIRQTLGVFSAPSPQVLALQREVLLLQADYDQQSGDGSPAGAAAASPLGGAGLATTTPQLPSEILRLDQETREDRDPATVYARGQLRDAMDRYATLRTQVRASQIDLETAQAAFKYRYSVLTPAHLPRRPVKPSLLPLLLAALLAASLAGVLSAVIADLRGGRLVERWQVERLIGRPILGEMDVP